MYSSLAAAPAQTAPSPILQAINPLYLDIRTFKGNPYQAIKPLLAQAVMQATVEWNLKSVTVAPLSGMGHVDLPKIQKNRTEIASLTPFKMKSARDYGTANVWMNPRIEAGRGIILVPAPGWTGGGPGGQLQTINAAWMLAIATEDFSVVQKHASPGQSGFVIREPKDGWKTHEEFTKAAKAEVTKAAKAEVAMKTVGIVAAIALVGGVGYMILKKR